MAQSNITGPMDRTEAQAVTDRIRSGLDNLSSLLLEARDRKAFKALGYATWEAYVTAEFSISLRRSYQLVDHEIVNRALTDATGDVCTSVHISEAAARDIKPVLPSVTADIRQRVDAGEDPKTAVDEAVDEARESKAKARAEREAQQAEFDRQRQEHTAALPDAIKLRAQAKADAIAARKADPVDEGLSPVDRVAELEEAVRVLEGENAELKAENKIYSEMRVQFEQGGFDKVVAGKDEVILGLETRLYRESADKASWMKASKFWQAEAKKLGYSRNAEIDIETGEVTNG